MRKTLAIFKIVLLSILFLLLPILGILIERFMNMTTNEVVPLVMVFFVNEIGVLYIIIKMSIKLIKTYNL